VIGDKQPYLTCLVMIDQENVEKFAQDHDISVTNYASLCLAAERPRSGRKYLSGLCCRLFPLKMANSAESPIL
jgi:hypothetical protein